MREKVCPSNATSNRFVCLASGLGQDVSHRSYYSHAWKLCIAACLTLAVSGCSNTNAEYPNLGRITDMGNVLTPEEQKKAIDDAQKQSGSSTSKAKN